MLTLRYYRTPNINDAAMLFDAATRSAMPPPPRAMPHVSPLTLRQTQPACYAAD